MDISDLPVSAGALLVLVALLAVFLLVSRSAKRLSSPWLRRPVQGGATAAAVLTVISLALLLLANYSCVARGPTTYSPDGKHVAVITWAIGPLAISDDTEVVRVRPRYSPFAKKVYFGPGYAGETEYLQVRWIDNNHLLIRHDEWVGYNYDHACTDHVFGVEITCAPIESSLPAAIQMVGPKAMCDAAAEKLRELHVNKVVLSIAVSPDGEMGTFNTLFPDGLDLEKTEAVAEAMKKIRIEPAKDNGRPDQEMKMVVFTCVGP